MDFDPEAVRARRERLLLRLLHRTTEAMNAEMAERVRRRGFPEFQPSFTGILVPIDTEGTRIGIVAQRMHVSRQAASQAVRQIEALGLLERLEDPTDRRASMVRHTARGRALLVTAMAAMEEIEEEYRGILGAQGLAELVGLLTRLLSRIDPGGRLADPAGPEGSAGRRRLSPR